MTTKTDITITCDDGYSLAATLFEPTQEQSVKTAIMLSPATGIKRGFYSAIAEYLSEQGNAVITFDNRGIGDSLNSSVKRSKATARDWGYLDMPAVLAELMGRFPQASYHLVGHSAGGQLVGLMHNHDKLSSMFNFACSSGQLRNMRLSYQLKAQIFMNAFIPANNALFGFANTQWVGMGEPLPKGVAKDWRYWCNGAGYVKTAFGKSIKQHWYDDVDCPALWANATDDDIANDVNVADMTRVFTKQAAERLILNPKELGLKEIGHMKFFSRKSKVLWPILDDWIKRNTA